VPRLRRHWLGAIAAGLLVVAVAFLVGGRGRIYTVAASEACLKGLDDRALGLRAEVDRGSNELTEGAPGGTLRVTFRQGKEEFDSVALGFYDSAQSANERIAVYRAYWAGFNARPETTGDFLHRRANVAVNWFNPDPARIAVVERCLT
jgi:hypothetical protein